MDTFQKLNRIGEGTYGLVYRAIDRRNNRMVALKRLDYFSSCSLLDFTVLHSIRALRIIMHNEKHDGFPVTTLREISALKRVSDHPNCVKVCLL